MLNVINYLTNMCQSSQHITLLKLFVKSPYLTHHQAPRWTHCKSKKKTNGKRRNWGVFPSSQHFEGRRACWSSEMGLRRLTNISITHANLHKPNNKLISA